MLLALAIAHKRLTATEAWAAAHVDEDFQMELWGFDDEALERRARARRNGEGEDFAREFAGDAVNDGFGWLDWGWGILLMVGGHLCEMSE